MMPESPDDLVQRGTQLLFHRQHNAAAAMFRRALALQPDHLTAHANLVWALRDSERLEDAHAAVRRALVLHPRSWRLQHHLFLTLHALGRYPEADAVARRVHELAPETAAAWYDRGLSAQTRLDLDEALMCYARAIVLDPGRNDARYNRGAIGLARRRFQGAWASWLGLTNRPAPQPLSRLYPPYADCSQPVWKGESLNGRTILVFAEAGYGDKLQFVRYARALRTRWDCRIVLVGDPALVRLFARCPEFADVRTLADPPVPFDVYAGFFALPHLLGNVDELAETIPYLTASAPAPCAAPTCAGALRVGLVWGGGGTTPTMAARSIPFAALAPLFEVPGVQFSSLQVGPQAAERLAHPRGAAVTDRASALHDFADTADALAALDLVISIDTSVAHLAGALGVPTWILLKHYACWRWGVDGRTSHWYPTARLFRQPDHGAWGTVVAEVRAALADAVAQHAPRSLLTPSLTPRAA